MIIIRPDGIRRTPYALAAALGCSTRRWPNKQPLRPDYVRDFIMAVVPPTEVRNYVPEYATTYAFATRHKLGQRQQLAAAVRCPRTAGTHADAATLGGTQYVVRPLRHSGGRGYRVTADRLDFTPGQEYVSELYPKRREYRVIFLFGRPLIWLRKKPNEGVGPEAPWGHTNSVFQTINDVPGSRLAQTDAVSRLEAFGPIRGAHIAAADILWSDRAEEPYVVLELNFCPGLDIDNNRAKVVQAIQERSALNQGLATPLQGG